MRIRDKLCPEGTIRRKFLRATAHVLKGFKPHNLKTLFKMLKENGLKKSIKEIRAIIIRRRKNRRL